MPSQGAQAISDSQGCGLWIETVWGRICSKPTALSKWAAVWRRTAYKNAIGAYYGNTIIRTESDEETVSWLVAVNLTKVHWNVKSILQQSCRGWSEPDEKLHPAFMAYPGGDDHKNRGRERDSCAGCNLPINAVIRTYRLDTRLRYAHAETHRRVESGNMKRADRTSFIRRGWKPTSPEDKCPQRWRAIRKDNPESDYRNLKQTYVTN